MNHMRHTRRPRGSSPAEDHRRVGVHQSGPASQLLQSPPFTPRIRNQSRKTAHTKQPPPKHGQRNDLDPGTGGLEAISELAAFWQPNGHFESARMQAG